jgi:hypothetical protein
LVDPNVAPVRSLSREERELMIAANNGYVLAFDNLSGLRNWLSDALCRLATGGSFAVRQLYTDDEEILFEAARPILLNGTRGVCLDHEENAKSADQTSFRARRLQKRPQVLRSPPMASGECRRLLSFYPFG